jgi:hypothetical protein
MTLTIIMALPGPSMRSHAVSTGDIRSWRSPIDVRRGLARACADCSFLVAIAFPRRVHVPACLGCILAKAGHAPR